MLVTVLRQTPSNANKPCEKCIACKGMNKFTPTKLTDAYNATSTTFLDFYVQPESRKCKQDNHFEFCQCSCAQHAMSKLAALPLRPNRYLNTCASLSLSLHLSLSLIHLSLHLSLAGSLVCSLSLTRSLCTCIQHLRGVS